MAADRPDDDDPARALGRALRDLQRRSGCTLRSLETSVRISDSSLSRYFRGTTVPPWATVRDLCEALDGDPTAYRHLWEAADRGQRRPVQGTVQGTGPDTGTDSGTGRDSGTGTGTGTDSGTGTGTGTGSGPKEVDAPNAGDAPPRAPRRRLSLRSGHTVWALAGAVLGLVLGVTGTALVQHRTPAADAPKVLHGAPAASAVPDHPRIFVSRATGTCLDDSLDKGTRSYACNGLSYQRWTVGTVTTDGSVRLRNHATGRCLDLGPAGLSAAACGPSASQRWTVTARDDSAVEIRGAGTRRCLADGAGGLRVLPCDRAPHQQWA
ncbi:XRE family transcriptional regulator [Streptomyces sp. NBC_00094]|uniref:XRE family transcriptional regulator n=1 Tax=Streptomyces sp. NBC_00094 TaxID=2903620 RepID=UPI00224CAA65|nr:XRE family transcriptional regulator [Streptomyces sp. NBC_00094]MCX5388987.1 RICIN domain-containing protein [Streptomyces sp. NBC_00094]